MRRSVATVAAVVAAALPATACTSAHAHDNGALVAPTITASPTSTPSTTPAPHRVRRPAQPSPSAVHVAAFAYRVGGVTAASLGKSWHAGCPVGPSDLATVSMTYWGFDHAVHTGTLVVNRRVVTAVVTAFRSIYAARFPIRRMVPIAAYGGSDNRSMSADNTSAFNCRRAVSDGPPSWSMHAFGEAVDIDPVENPYRLNGKILPPQGAPYMNRSDVRPGMVVRGSAPVRAFAALGWGWGGNWSSTPDYQHFSTNGR